jgi:hypothetical protein
MVSSVGRHIILFVHYINILLLINVLVVCDFNADYCLALVCFDFEFVFVYLIACLCVFVVNFGEIAAASFVAYHPYC